MHSRPEPASATTYRRDYYAGSLIVLLGLGAVMKGMTYDVGSLSRMGPGFFPVSIGVVMILSGLGIAASNIPIEPQEERERPEWRGWICIILGIFSFAVLGTYGGMVPATFATVFIAALGDRANSIKDALLLALALCVVAAVVFWWALQVQLPLFQWG